MTADGCWVAANDHPFSEFVGQQNNANSRIMKINETSPIVRIVACAMIVSQLNFGAFLAVTARAHYCWDPVYHPGLTTMCECDPIAETACTAVKEIMKDGWISCPAVGAPPGSDYEGVCTESSQNVGIETDCNPEIDADGVLDCLAWIAGLGLSTAGLMAPTGVSQVVGFVGLIISTWQVWEECKYCEMALCSQDPDTLVLISRSVISNNPTVCGHGG